MTSGSIFSSRVFSWDLQERFADLSGDRNPIHMDPMAARRTQAGRPVVHGVHTLLWALDSLAEATVFTSAPVRIKAKFLKWIYVGDKTSLVLPVTDGPGPRTFRVEVDGLSVLTVELEYDNPRPMDERFQPALTPRAPRSAAADWIFSDLNDYAGTAFTANEADVSVLFPSLTLLLSRSAVAEIAACSYVVGMEVPGLFSMFSRLDLTIRRNESNFIERGGLHFRVISADIRFRKVRIVVTGRSIFGDVEAFSRVPPVAQKPMEGIAAYVSKSEFRGMTALVVGGSRGLGELTAKLIAAGGGTPIITYSVGLADAERLSADIRAWGGNAEIMHYDVRQPAHEQLGGLRSRPSHLFYFATSAIFRSKENLVSPSILADFSAFYLLGFHDLCSQLLKQFAIGGAVDRPLAVYYPSSVAVDERPNGMTEYAMVKAAGEQLCRDMNMFLTGLRILTTRLPRLRTDQTATIVPERELDSVAVMLPIIRQMQALADD